MLTEKITEEIIKAAFVAETPLHSANRDMLLKKYTEPIDIIDDDDNNLGIEDVGLCHALGLRHKAVFVFPVSPAGKILLQRRKGDVPPVADLLHVAVASHAAVSEDIGPCAVRKIKENFTFKPKFGRLKFIASFNRNSPFSLSHPREINNEQRSLFEYAMNTAEMTMLSESMHTQDGTKDTTIEWCQKEDIIEAINMNRATDELLTCFLHYLVHKCPDRAMNIG